MVFLFILFPYHPDVVNPFPLHQFMLCTMQGWCFEFIRSNGINSDPGGNDLWVDSLLYIAHRKLISHTAKLKCDVKITMLPCHVQKLTNESKTKVVLI